MLGRGGPRSCCDIDMCLPSQSCVLLYLEGGEPRRRRRCYLSNGRGHFYERAEFGQAMQHLIRAVLLAPPHRMSAASSLGLSAGRQPPGAASNEGR